MDQNKNKLYFLFFISGSCGLIYEVLWSRYLGLFIGNTTYAHAMVLALFMGGLALGNFIFGKMADRIKSYLSAYAYLEIGIGIYAILTPLIFLVMRKFFIFMVQGSTPGSMFIHFLKLLCSAPILLIPSILMGGTLPFMAHAFIGKKSDVQRETSRLYSINSFGAVSGALVSAFFLIPVFGINKSLFIAAFLSLTVGAIVFFIKNKINSETILVPENKIEGSSFVIPEISKNALLFLLISAAVSGFISMSYELAWFRLFALILGSSTYSFAIMLAAFISGIAIGSIIISKINFNKSKIRPFYFIAICHIVIGLSVLLSMLFYERLPYIFSVIKNTIPKEESMFLLFESFKYLFCFIVIVIPTIFFGMALPLTTTLASSNLKNLGKSIGKVFSVNTVGAVLGSLITGFFLIPALNIQGTFKFAIIVNILMGVILLTVYKPKKSLIKVPVILVFSGLFLFFSPDWSPTILSSGVFRKRHKFKTYKSFADTQRRKKVVYHKDGTQVTVVVGKQINGKELFLKVNGKTDASTSGDVKTQLLSSHVPLLLHPDPKNVLNIGIGSGMTCGAVLRHPIERLDIAEISKEVYIGSRYFKDYNNAYFADPRTHVYIEDAVTLLKIIDRKYDIIASEPSNIWISGIGGLYSKEFFQEIHSKLLDDGIFMQWFHAYEMSTKTAEVILRTMNHVFPYIYIWSVKGNDILCLATKNPLNIDIEKLTQRLEEPILKSELAKVGVYDVSSLFLLQVAGATRSKEIVSKVGRMNSDYAPYLEYQAPKDLFMKVRTNLFHRTDAKISNIQNSDLFLLNYIEKYGLTEENFENMYKALDKDSYYYKNLQKSVVLRWQQDFPVVDESIETLKHELFTETNNEINSKINLALLAKKRFDASIVNAALSPDAVALYSYLYNYFQVYKISRSIFIDYLDMQEWLSYLKDYRKFIRSKEQKKRTYIMEYQYRTIESSI